MIVYSDSVLSTVRIGWFISLAQTNFRVLRSPDSAPQYKAVNVLKTRYCYWGVSRKTCTSRPVCAGDSPSYSHADIPIKYPPPPAIQGGGANW